MAAFRNCCEPPQQRRLLAGADAFHLPLPHCLPQRRGGAHGCRPSLLRKRRCRHRRRVGRSEAEADVDDSIKEVELDLSPCRCCRDKRLRRGGVRDCCTRAPGAAGAVGTGRRARCPPATLS